MAKLEQVAESLNITIVPKKTSILDEKAIGRKRRSWIEDEESPGPNEPIVADTLAPEKGFIKGVYTLQIMTLDQIRSNPRKVLHYLYERTLSPQKITEKITTKELMKTLGISKDSVRTAVRFLLKTNVIKKVELQIGKLGWSKYAIDALIFTELETSYKTLASPSTQLLNRDEKMLEHNESLAWDEVDIAPLESIGFKKSHLVQLKTKNMAEVVQESINHFAYGLQHNPKTKSYADPINVFMGVLRKGEPWIEATYKSPKEMALEKMLEEKRKQREKIQALEEEILRAEFEDWYQNLSEKEIAELTQDAPTASLPSSLQKRALKGYLFNYYKEKKHK